VIHVFDDEISDIPGYRNGKIQQPGGAFHPTSDVLLYLATVCYRRRFNIDRLQSFS
jgi:hypothetical protein